MAESSFANQKTLPFANQELLGMRSKGKSTVIEADILTINKIDEECHSNNI